LCGGERISNFKKKKKKKKKEKLKLYLQGKGKLEFELWGNPQEKNELGGIAKYEIEVNIIPLAGV